MRTAEGQVEQSLSCEGCRLLLVDDEHGFREAVAKRLTRRGLIPIQASTGEACLEILDKTPMDVVVLDVKMPGIDGIQTLKIIKERYPSTQVILLTGNAAVSDGIQGLNAGAFDYLTKPIELDHLVNKIQQAFDIIRLEQGKKQDAEFREKLERRMIITDKLASLGTLSTGIAHEINNPLAIINDSAGFMRTVLEKPEMRDIPRREVLVSALVKIEKSIDRARKITHQLLGYVKQPAQESSETDIHILLEETLELLKKELQNKEVAVVLDKSPSRVVIRSDPSQIRQVLINLLTNAIHAVPVKGSIVITVGEDKSGVALSIRDDGTGIPRENLKKIFDPFFTTKSNNEGTGLGLYVVHKIITGLGGEIFVDSELGMGSTFTVHLPKCPKGKGEMC
jgi:signal transduction histidine kinase